MFFKQLIKHEWKQRSNDNGFTLIEVLIAVAILAIGILGLAKMQIAAIKGNACARKGTEAMVIAQKQIETLMGQLFDSITTTSTEFTLPEGHTYTVTWTVTDSIDLDGDGNNDFDLDGDGNNEIKSINVVVNDSGGRQRANINYIKAADI